MGKEILKCMECGSYTLLLEHCGKRAGSVRPAKFSPIDKMGGYRRRYKQNVLEN